MGYKVTLDDCDPLVEVVLLSEAEVEQARVAVGATPSISPGIRNAYAQARNRLFSPSLARVWADLPTDSLLVVWLVTKELSDV